MAEWQPKHLSALFFSSGMDLASSITLWIGETPYVDLSCLIFRVFRNRGCSIARSQLMDLNGLLVDASRNL
ncbi:hypothetical protein DTO271G3_5069 [Paecilomyces variotii]|nr:hypothetical protein DTO271G3_5069 [Paecilomyces variotii]